MADMNVNQSNIEKITQYLQQNGESTKEVSSKEVESVFNTMSGNGAEAVETEEFATTLAEKFLEREIDEIEDDYLAAWEDFAASDGEKGKLSSDDMKIVSDLLDAYKESKLPDGWKVEDGVVKDADGNEVVATDPKDLPEGHKITDDGKILDESGKQIGVVAETEVYDPDTNTYKTVESFYTYPAEEADATEKTEKPVSKDDLPEGYSITDDGKILDKDGKEIGRTEVSYDDATSDGVNDRITQYFLYEEKSELPEGWTEDENGVIKDENGRELSPVDAQTIDEGNYNVKDGVIYNEFGQEVGRVVSQESDAIGEDGVPETVDSYYLYNDVPEIQEVQIPPSELPEGYTITDDGKILDKDGNVFGCIKESYIDAANGDGVNDKVTQYFKYEEVPAEETKMPEGWVENEDGTVTDENGNKLLPVDAQVIDEGDYEVKDGKIFDKDGNEVGRVVSQETDAIDEEGEAVDETVDSYYLYVLDEPAPIAEEPSQGSPVIEDEPTTEELPPLESGTDPNVPTTSPTPPPEDAIIEDPEDPSKGTVITDDAAAQFAKQLYDTTAGRMGTDEQQFRDILENPDLTSDDWVKIISAYNESYGSFIQDVDADFSSMSGKEDIMTGITSKLLEAAEGGSEDAVKLLAKEFHNGTAGMTGTADEFVAAFMNSASDEVLMAVMESYAEVNDGADIYDAVKKDFSGQIEDAYIARLNEILAKMRE